MAYDAEIQRVLKTHPDGELYQSLPGAGDLLAARMVGELGDNRERYADAAAANARLVPPRSPEPAVPAALSMFAGLASIPCAKRCGTSPSVA